LSTRHRPVASRDHMPAGVAGGFRQLSHDKAALMRLAPGDPIAYYSPRTRSKEGKL